MLWALLVPLTLIAASADGKVVCEALGLSPALDALLATGKWDLAPKGFRIVTLSFLADGCVAEARRDPGKHEAAEACVRRCLELAKRTGQASPEKGDGLWLTHYALILGAADALGPCPEPARHHAIASALARRSLADPHRHVASYSRLTSRWPADQTATLASLARHDRAHGTKLMAEPARIWRDYVLAKAMDAKLGLPFSEVTGSRSTSREPRGCALSWQTRYLHEFDDPLARQWWTRYRASYLIERLGLAGFREWPPGRDRGGDVDSGPIVAGIGAAATGLGIAAARAMGDDELAGRLDRMVALGKFAAGKQAKGVLPEAIRYLGAQLRP